MYTQFVHFNRVTFTAPDLTSAATAAQDLIERLAAEQFTREPRVSISSRVTFDNTPGNIDYVGVLDGGYDVEITWETQS